jgi:hypothetical protein
MRAASQFARDLFTDMEIDLNQGLFVDRLEEGIASDGIHRRLMINEISRRQSVQQRLGFGLIGGQLDHEV